MSPPREPKFLTASPRSLLATLVLAGCVAGCVAGSDKPGGAGSFSPGKGDGVFDLVEVGPLEPGATHRLALDAARVPAFRVESFGGTRLELTLSATSAGGAAGDAYLVVEGPLPGDGDETPAGTAAVFAEDDDGGAGLDARLTVTLATPGVYRVLAGTYETLSGGAPPAAGTALVLSSACTAACGRATLPAADFLVELARDGALPAFRAVLAARLVTLVPDEAQRAELLARFDALVAGVASGATLDPAALARFPLLDVTTLPALRPLLGSLPDATPAADAVVDGELDELLGRCLADRAPPPPVHPSLPDVGYGHFPDRALTACQVARSEALARLLTALAAGNGSVVRLGARELTTPAELVDALVAEGHVVELRNERTYANFISLTWRGLEVVWPTWLDAGLALPSGRRLVVPAGHSHHAFRIRGPRVDGRVMFFLGVTGTGFFAQTSLRPLWTGHTVSASADTTTPAGAARVRAALDAAAAYLRRNRVERAGPAAGLPADGYGVLGICNDSNAVLELATAGTITTWPLLRAAWLDDEPALGDGLDDVVRALPHDADQPPALAEVGPRVRAMQPHAAGGPYVLDAEQGAVLAELEALFP